MIVLFSGIMLGITLGIIYPTIKDIKSLNRETYSLRLFLEKRLQRATNIRATIEKIPKIKADSEVAARHLFTAGRELELITTLENLATKHTVTQTIRSSNLDQSSTSYVTLSLAITGTYRDTVQYLAGLEGLPYFITIRQLEFSPRPARGGEKEGATVQMNLELTLYVNS